MIKLTNQTLYDNCLAEKQEQQQKLILQALTQDDPDAHCLALGLLPGLNPGWSKCALFNWIQTENKNGSLVGMQYF